MQIFKILILFLLLSIALTSAAFFGLNKGEFLFVGDQYFPFSLNETYINSLFVKRLEYLGVHNGYQLVTQFWSSVYYKVFYSFNSSFILAQRIEYFGVFFISFILSFLGFRYAGRSFEIKMTNTFLLILTIWYCINPYTLSLWHGGVYNFGSAFTYSLAPFIISAFINFLRDKIEKRYTLVLILSVSISTFTFWLFAPLGLLLLILTIILLFISADKIRYLQRLIFLGALLLITNSFVLFNVFFEQFDNKSSNNSEYIATFTNQLGGLDYQFKMMFSWGIYNVWHPRTLYPFGEFFYSEEYFTSLRILYITLAIILLLSIITGPRRRVIIFGVFLLALQYFLAKGPQKPLGEIFIFLYEKVPLFSIFRTPDIRFGFTIELMIAALYLISYKNIWRFFVPTMLLLVVGIQGRFFFDGTVHKGMNVSNKYVDRVLSIPVDMQNAVNYLNTNYEPPGYIFFYPPYEYTHYIFDKYNSFIGQDVFSKLVYYHPIYLSQSKGIYSTTYNQLSSAINSQNLDIISNFPIKYVVYRNDIFCKECEIHLLDFENNWNKVYENSTYKIFQINNSSNIVTNSQGEGIEYSVVNPTMLNGKSSVENTEIQLRLSYDKNWTMVYLDGLIPRFSQAKQKEFYNYFEKTNYTQASKFIIFYTPQFFLYLVLIINSGAIVCVLLNLMQISRRVKSK